MDILALVSRVPFLVFGPDRNDDDFADRMNYKYTVAVLVIFAIIVTNRQFGQKQIHCWIPAHFTRNYEDYINDVCWVSNTYYVDLGDKLPKIDSERKKVELKYYQWVPFILLCEAFFFYIPNICWRALSRRSGIDMRDLVEAANNYKSVEKCDKQEKYMNYLIISIDQYVDDPRRRKEIRKSTFLENISKSLLICYGKFLGNYLVMLYTTIKLLYITNCIIQIFVLNYMLGQEFHRFGFNIIQNILDGKGWEMTNVNMFPKVSMCDFKYHIFFYILITFNIFNNNTYCLRIREIGNPKISHRYTVQCVLPINLFNQQIFTFIWFWYAFILLINLFSFSIWIYRLLPHARFNYIKRRILIHTKNESSSNNFTELKTLEEEDIVFDGDELRKIKKFVSEYLEPDGAFMLRVLSSNVCDFVCTKIIYELWKAYHKDKKFNRLYSTDEPTDFDDDDEEDDVDNSDNEMKNIADALVQESLRHRKMTLIKQLPTIDEQSQLKTTRICNNNVRKRTRFLKKLSHFSLKSKKRSNGEHLQIPTYKRQAENLLKKNDETIREFLKPPSILVTGYKETQA